MPQEWLNMTYLQPNCRISIASQSGKKIPFSFYEALGMEFQNPKSKFQTIDLLMSHHIQVLMSMSYSVLTIYEYFESLMGLDEIEHK